MSSNNDQMRVHAATPQDERASNCIKCGQRIKSVPGGQGTTWVHTDSGAVAAPNPPLMLDADHLHVLLDVLHVEPDAIEPWNDYTADPQVDPKASRDGWLKLRDEAKVALESALSVI